MKDNKLTFENWVRENYEVLSDDEMHERYDDYLDDITGEINIGCLTFSGSRIVKELDETAYRCGFNDYLDGEAYFELDDDYVMEDEDELRELYDEYLEEE